MRGAHGEIMGKGKHGACVCEGGESNHREDVAVGMERARGRYQ